MATIWLDPDPGELASGLAETVSGVAGNRVRSGQTQCPMWPVPGHDGHDGRVFLGKRLGAAYGPPVASLASPRARFLRCVGLAHPVEQV